MGEDVIESSFAEKNLRALVDEKPDMSQQGPQPNVSWAASKEEQPAGHGKGFYCSTLPL